MNDNALLMRKKDLERKIGTLEWDKKRNQIHFARSAELEAYKKELATLQIDIGKTIEGFPQ